MTTDGRRSSPRAGRPAHRTPPHEEPPVEHRTRYRPGPQMSASLVVSAAYLDDLSASAKLVLMALADSADDDGTGSIPGLAKLRAWSGLGKSRVLEVLGELVDAGWVNRTGAGRRGQRATFTVFPRGVPPIPSAGEVVARYSGSDPADPSTGNPQVGITEKVIHSPDELGSGPTDPNEGVRVRSDPPQGPAGRTPSLPPFEEQGARGNVGTTHAVDNRPRAGSAGSSPAASNNGQAERPVAEVLAETRRTKPADATARAAQVRTRLAEVRAARQPTTEEPAP